MVQGTDLDLLCPRIVRSLPSGDSENTLLQLVEAQPSRSSATPASPATGFQPQRKPAINRARLSAPAPEIGTARGSFAPTSAPDARPGPWVQTRCVGV